MVAVRHRWNDRRSDRQRPVVRISDSVAGTGRRGGRGSRRRTSCPGCRRPGRCRHADRSWLIQNSNQRRRQSRQDFSCGRPGRRRVARRTNVRRGRGWRRGGGFQDQPLPDPHDPHGGMRSQLHRQGSAARIEHIDPGNMWGSRALEMNRPVEVQQLLIAASRRAAGDSIRKPDRQTAERSMIPDAIRYDRSAGCTGLTGKECGGQNQPQAGEAISMHHVTLARSLSYRIDPGA